jgi:Meiotically up-regulated gene 113
MTELVGKKQGGMFSWWATDVCLLTSYYDRVAMQDSGGWVYAMTEDGTPLVKIGHTRFGTRHRLQNLAYAIQASVTLVGAVAVPIEVGRIERQVHRLLRSQEIAREWFYTYMNQAMLEDLVRQAHAQPTFCRYMSRQWSAVGVDREPPCSRDSTACPPPGGNPPPQTFHIRP